MNKTLDRPSPLSLLLRPAAPAEPMPALAPAPPVQPVPSPKSASLKKSFSWTFLGNLVYAGCQWGVLLVLAKLGTSSLVGRYALANGIATPIALLLGMGLRSAQATDVRGEFDFSEYLGFRLVTTAVGLIVTLAVGAIGGGGVDLSLLAVLAVSRGLEAVSDVFYGLFQLHERLDLAAKVMLVKGPLSLAIVALALALTHNLVLSCALSAVVLLIAPLAVELPAAAAVARRSSRRAGKECRRALGVLRPSFELPRFKKLLILALPIGLMWGLRAFWINIPRYFIAYHQGDSAVGIFTAVVAPLVAGTMIINAIAQTVSPRLARSYAAGDARTFNRLLLRITSLAALIGAVGLLCSICLGRTVLGILYRKEYADHVDVFVWAMLAYAIQYTSIFLGSAMGAMRKFLIQVPVHVAGTASVAIACYLLVPRFGMRGGAMALCASCLVEGVATCLAFRQAKRR